MQNSVAKKIFAVGSAVAMTLAVAAPFVALAAVHADGTNVLDSSGTVYMVVSGQRRPYTSAGAFLSYGFNSFASVVSASPEDLALPVGAFIPPQDGSIMCSDRGSDKGTCYEISGAQKFGFTSAAVFTGLGFSFANSMMGDVSWMPAGATLINNTTMAHLPGTLVNNNGTVQLVGNTGLLGIPDLNTFNSWGYSFGKVVPANGSDKAMTQTGVMAVRVAGQLSPTALASCTSNCGTTPPPVVSGPISVSLSSDNPAAGALVSGEAAADLAHFTFTGSGSISQVTLQRTGITSNSSITNVYLFQGNQRITDAASVNTTGMVLFNNLNIAVNGSVTLSVRADISSSLTSGTLGMTLVSYMPTGNSAVTANLSGNVFTISSGSGILAGVDIKNSGILTPTSGTTVTANAGSTAFAFFQTNVQVNTHSVWLKGANFQVIGSAPVDALSNLQFYVNGAPVGNVATEQANGYVFFDFSGSPVQLNTGSTQIAVMGNIQKGSNRNVMFALQNAADFQVVDSQLNVGIAPTIDNSAFSPLDAGTVSINAGTLSASVDPTFQSLTNVTGGATNAVIGRFKLHAYGEDVKVMNLVVKPAVANGTPNNVDQLQNVTLYFGPDAQHLGQVGSSANYNAANINYSLGSSMVAPAGQDSYLEVRADIMTSTSTNYTGGTVTASLKFSASGNSAQGLSSLNTSNVLPSGDVSTSGLTIQTGALAIGKSSYANQTLSPNSPLQKIGEFTLQNQTSSEGVHVTQFTVKLTSDGSTVLTSSGDSTHPALTDFSNLKTSETSGAGNTPINPNGSNTFSVNFTLQPGASDTVSVWADLGNTAIGTSPCTGATCQFIVSLLPTAYGSSSGVNVTPAAAIQGQTMSLVGGAGSMAAPTFNTSQSSPQQYVASAAGGTPAVTSNAFNFTNSTSTSVITELKFVVASTTTGAVASVAIPNGSGTNTVSAPVVTPPTTTLSAAVTSTSGTSVSVTSASNIVVGSVISIASTTNAIEDMVVTAVSGTTLTVTRGVDNTVANTFTNGATVNIRGMADVTGLSIPVPIGQGGIYVNAQPTYANVGTNGVTSGTLAQLALTYQKYTSGGSTTAGAVTPVVANTMNLVGSKPVLSVTNTSNAGLVIGENHLIDVTVTPDSHGPVQLNQIVFSVSTTTSISGLSGARLAIGSTTITGSSCVGTTTVTCTLPSNYVLTPAGGAQTFSLFETIASSGGLGSAGTSSITASLAAASNFSWTDTAGNGSALTTANTTYLYNYPTQTWSIHN